jgi:hypothetical protein
VLPPRSGSSNLEHAHPRPAATIGSRLPGGRPILKSARRSIGPVRPKEHERCLQWTRHMRFHGVSWYAPAAMSIPPQRAGSMPPWPASPLGATSIRLKGAEIESAVACSSAMRPTDPFPFPIASGVNPKTMNPRSSSETVPSFPRSIWNATANVQSPFCGWTANCPGTRDTRSHSYSFVILAAYLPRRRRTHFPWPFFSRVRAPFKKCTMS